MRETDITIIGGGPAGMSAAFWCADLGLEAVLIERSNELGGQLPKIFNPITNYLGVSAANGSQMLERFLRSVDDSKFIRMLNIDVTRLDPNSMSVHLADGSEVASRAVIVATGVRRRSLGVPGEKEFRGKGILESGARDRHLTNGKRVLIVGGGDAAIENALLLSEFASEVLVAFRRTEPTARDEFMRRVNSRSNVRLMPRTTLKELRGNSVLEAVNFEDATTGQHATVPVDAVLIRIGVEPNSELARDIVELNEAGYIKVDAGGRTNLSGIFAIGDVAHPASPTISTAVGTGATASKLALDLIRG